VHHTIVAADIDPLAIGRRRGANPIARGKIPAFDTALCIQRIDLAVARADIDHLIVVERGRSPVVPVDALRQTLKAHTGKVHGGAGGVVPYLMPARGVDGVDSVCARLEEDKTTANGDSCADRPIGGEAPSRHPRVAIERKEETTLGADIKNLVS